jgi:hypothetical protein
MESFKQFFEATQGITVYHGTKINGLKSLKGNNPKYEGGLGYGVYVAIQKETAKYYGPHVYQLQTNFGWDKVFRIDGETSSLIEGAEGYSILNGEHISPFYFRLKNVIYVVTNGIDFSEFNMPTNGVEINLDDIGEYVSDAGYKSVYLDGMRSHCTVNEEMLIFNENDLIFMGQIG